MKKFFTVIPLQGKGNLDQYHYQPVENERLAMEEKTAFPIVPVMNGYLQPGEESQVIAVVIENADTNRNYQQFMEEVDALCARKGLVHPEIKKVVVPMDDSVNAHIDLFQKLIEYTEENDEQPESENSNKKPAKIEVINGGNDLEISPVSDYLEIEKPRAEKKENIVIPEEKKD